MLDLHRDRTERRAQTAALIEEARMRMVTAERELHIAVSRVAVLEASASLMDEEEAARKRLEMVLKHWRKAKGKFIALWEKKLTEAHEALSPYIAE